jgi:hypothetical protein
MTTPLPSRALALLTLRGLLVVPVLSCAVPVAPAQRPSPAAAPVSLEATERAIVNAVDARGTEALALLERIVNINSGTMNFPGVRDVGAVLRAEFDALGFTTRWVDGAPFGRAGHLVAEHPGTGPETADLRMLPALTKRAALLLYRLSQGTGH